MCKRYEDSRSRNCRTFPIDERDLADRDLVAPDTPCGFYFENGAPPASDEGQAPDA